LAEDGAARQLDQDLNAVISGNSAFAYELYGRLKQAEGNLFFSPLNISTALAMTYAGARGNTERQMAKALRFALSQEGLHSAFGSIKTRLDTLRRAGRVQLSIANSLWLQAGYSLLEPFLSFTRKHYDGTVALMDCHRAPEAARLRINSWVEERTERRIKDVIRPGLLNPLVRLVLVSAIYFKGDWASPFEKWLTEHAPFWISPEVSLPVPMMARTGSYKYAEEDGLQILELPYAGGDLSMVVLLPKQISGLAETENALIAERLDHRLQHLEEKKIRVFLPRFRIGYEFWLNDALKEMGMIDAFDMDKANFSGMDGNENYLYIAAVLHKAFVDVNEEGTEATAGTAVIMKGRAMLPPTPVFRADHPFVFVVRDNSTASVLFIGRVVNPIE